MNFFIKKNKLLFLFFVIFFLAIILRAVNAIDGFAFAHDGDLYSWIVKDILVNHHFRLIGQETSTTGIFIGPLFYYSLVPFYLISSMDPIGAIQFSVILSIATLISFYFVFTKLFDKSVGLIAFFLQSILVSRVGWDRWVVPTITTSLWEVWYLFTIINLARGNFLVLPLLGLLVGLIWHISLFLAPTLLAVPMAFILAKKLPSYKETLKAILFFFIPAIPFIIFEIRHNFSQSNAFINSFTLDQGGGMGVDKFIHVLYQISGNAVSLFFYPTADLFVSRYIFLFLLLLIGVVLAARRVIGKKELVTLYSWIFGVILFFSTSSKIISEYYLSNINVIFITIAAIGLTILWKNRYLGKTISIFIVLILTFYNIPYFFKQNYSNGFGYKERKEVAKFISEDSRMKDLPCISVSYITIPGENVGFRYFFFLSKLHVNQPISGSPVYTILIPATIYDIKPDTKFGNIGVITPKDKVDIKKLKHSCSGQNSNLTDPLFGYTE